MTLSSVARALLTRWYVVGAGLLLTAAVAGVIFSIVPPSYSSNAVAMLVQPKLSYGRSGNPLLDIDVTLNTSSTMVLQTLNTVEVAADVKRSTGCTYKITQPKNVITVDPFIFVSAQCDSPGQAAATVNYFLDRANEVLVDYQRGLGVLPSKCIRIQTTVGASVPQYVLVSRRTATAGAALMLGIVLIVLIVLSGERRARDGRVRGRRHRDPAPIADSGIPHGRTHAVNAVARIDHGLDHRRPQLKDFGESWELCGPPLLLDGRSEQAMGHGVNGLDRPVPEAPGETTS
jgi:hypothetical protein